MYVAALISNFPTIYMTLNTNTGSKTNEAHIHHYSVGNNSAFPHMQGYLQIED